jgi:hypothetical protein
MYLSKPKQQRANGLKSKASNPCVLANSSSGFINVIGLVYL